MWEKVGKNGDTYNSVNNENKGKRELKIIQYIKKILPRTLKNVNSF